MIWPDPDDVLIVLLAAYLLVLLADTRRWISSYISLSPAGRIALPSLIGASVMLGWRLYPFQATQPLAADTAFAAIILGADPLRSLLFACQDHGCAVDPESLWLVSSKALGGLVILWLFALLRRFDLSEFKSLCVAALVAVSPLHLRLMSAEPSYLLFLLLVLAGGHHTLSFARGRRTADWLGALLCAAAAAHLFAFYLALPLVILSFAWLFRLKDRAAGPLFFLLSLAGLAIYVGAVLGAADLPRVQVVCAPGPAAGSAGDMLFLHGLLHPFFLLFILLGLLALLMDGGAGRLALAAVGLIPAACLALSPAGRVNSPDAALVAYGLALPPAYLSAAAGMAALDRWLGLSRRSAAWACAIIAFLLVHYQILSQVMVAR